MSRRKRNLLIPEAREQVDKLKARVMKEKGYHVSENAPNLVKYEVAKELHIPLNEKYNGTLTSKQAGSIGGQIGGSMVKEMIKMAESKLSEQDK